MMISSSALVPGTTLGSSWQCSHVHQIAGRKALRLLSPWLNVRWHLLFDHPLEWSVGCCVGHFQACWTSYPNQIYTEVAQHMELFYESAKTSSSRAALALLGCCNTVYRAGEQTRHNLVSTLLGMSLRCLPPLLWQGDLCCDSPYRSCVPPHPVFVQLMFLPRPQAFCTFFWTALPIWDYFPDFRSLRILLQP